MERFSSVLRIAKQFWLLDLRSLAAFRVGIGSLILVDLVLRLGDLRAFYTDEGVIPRSLLSVGLAYKSQWSFHLMNGTATFQALLFLVAAVAAGMMAAGYHTRLATFVSWLLLVSLHSRNPLVLNAGDKYLAMLTFWGIFLPLGAVWSLDSMRQIVNREIGAKVTSLASFALTLQVLLLYVSTGWLKSEIEAWQTGEAIRFALLKDYLVTHWGQQLLEYPDLLRSLSRATIYLELIGPFLLLVSRGWLRVIAVAVFIAFHLALAACFAIGLFPWVCIVAFAAFLPAVFWDRLLGKPAAVVVSHFHSDYHGVWATMARRVILILTLMLAVWSSIQTLNSRIAMPEWLRDLGVAFRMQQSWRLFVNLHEVDNGWFVFHAQFADGSSEDWLTGQSPVSYSRPALASAVFHNFRWRKLVTAVRQEKFRPVATYLGEYLLLERDRTNHDVHKIAGLQVSYVKPISNEETSSTSTLKIFGASFPTDIPLEQEVLYEWRNEALKYQSAIITN